MGRVEQIEELGGEAGEELEDRIDTLEGYIEKIEGEVRGVQRELATV